MNDYLLWFFFSLLFLEPQKCDTENSSELNSSDESDTESGSSRGIKTRRNVIVSPLRRPSVLAAIGGHHYGSFYLRMGAVGMFRLKIKTKLKLYSRLRH